MADSSRELGPPRPKRVTQLSSERYLQKHLKKIRWLIICAISSARQTTNHQPHHQHPYSTTPPPLMHLILLFVIASLLDMLLGLVDNKRYPVYIKLTPFLLVAAITLLVFFRLTRHNSWTVLNWLPTLAELTGFLRDGCMKVLGNCRKQLEKREGKAVEE